MTGNAVSVLVLTMAALGSISAPVLRRRFPRTWWYCVTFPILWGRIRLTWRKLAWECDLAVTRKRVATLVGGLLVKGRELDPIVPHLAVGWPRPFTTVARVRMLPGQTPDIFVDATEAMAHAWRVHAVRASSPARGEVQFTITTHDPLAAPVGLVPRIRAGSRRLAELESVDMDEVGRLLRIPIGAREDGAPWVLDLRTVPHWLITGATQSGKSTLMNAAVIELATRPVALVGIDLKGGMELSAYSARLSALACDRKQAVRLLSALVDIVLERMVICRGAGVRSVWELPEPNRPVPIVVLVDELAELYLVPDRKDKEDATSCGTNLVRLAQLGAALGVHLLIAGQRVGSDLGTGVTALRAQLGGRICHRVTDPETAKMTIGDLFPDAGWRSPLMSAGAGYVLVRRTSVPNRLDGSRRTTPTADRTCPACRPISWEEVKHHERRPARYRGLGRHDVAAGPLPRGPDTRGDHRGPVRVHAGVLSPGGCDSGIPGRAARAALDKRRADARTNIPAGNGPAASGSLEAGLTMGRHQDIVTALLFLGALLIVIFRATIAYYVIMTIGVLLLVSLLLGSTR
jgi:S-DNA-T family DNA segregation ATPase FtsK/SpoIIIE